MHIFCVGYADSPAYRSFDENSKARTPFFELVSHMIRNGVNVQSYRKRSRLFLEMGFETKWGKAPNYFIIDTRGLISNLCDIIFKEYPCLVENKSCPNCQKSGERKYITLVANLYDKNIISLEESLKEFLAEQYGC